MPQAVNVVFASISSHKTGKSTYRFLLLLQQIETVLKLEIVYSWLSIVIVASALSGDVDTDGLDRRFRYDEIPWLLAEFIT